MEKAGVRHRGIVCSETRGVLKSQRLWVNKDGLEISRVTVSVDESYMGSGPNHTDTALEQSKIPSSSHASSFPLSQHGELRYNASLRTISPDPER